LAAGRAPGCDLGLNHLDYVPCYPGTTHVPCLEVALTPGEPQHVPAFVKRVIDIGDRVIDAKTIIDMASALGLERLLKEDRFLSEGQIRKALAQSQQIGLVRLSPGRGGTTITAAGIEALKRLRPG